MRFKPTAADQDTGALAYGNPFPTGWGTYGYVNVGYTVPYTVPGAVNPLNLSGSMTYAADKDSDDLVGNCAADWGGAEPED